MRQHAIESDGYRRRLSALGEALAEVEAVFVSSPHNVGYLSGSFMEPHERLMGLALRPGSEHTLVVPALDAEAASANPAGLPVIAWEDAHGPSEAVRSALGQPKTLAVEKAYLTMRMWEWFAETLGPEDVEDASTHLSDLRARKTREEVVNIEQAAQIVDEALAQLVTRLKVGISEVELALALDGLLRHFGSEGNPFETIVLSGPNAALPHGRPGTRRLQAGDLVVMDVGARRDGYCSDITRTYAIGEPGDEARRVYDTVHAAQAAGRAALEPGVTCASVDHAARQVIEAAGYGPFFIHRTGHGLGLEAHEPPSLVAGNEALLRIGEVVTVEPGIYLPGELGVRIEDDLVVTDDGARCLTPTPRELTVCGA